MRKRFGTAFLFGLSLLYSGFSYAQEVPLLPDSENILLTVFLKHDQSMNNDQRRELLDATDFDNLFPPEGVEVIDHYVMMGIGQVIVLSLIHI